VTRIDVSIPTPDGTCPASLHLPDAPPAPAVILFPDAGGLRETFRAMAARIAAEGYTVLVPDTYYRRAPWEPFDVATAFSDPGERERITSMARSVTPAMIVSDTAAFLDFLAERPEVSGATIGTTGYCMGGRASLLVAGRHPERIGAAASFHGGMLGSDDPDSPHQHGDHIRAGVYVAAAENDKSCPPEQLERLRKAFEAGGVRHTIETYPAAHGFAVPDNPTHDPVAEERHWAATFELFGTYLGGTRAS
jgi:carboxymethylenebutenolidase